MLGIFLPTSAMLNLLPEATVIAVDPGTPDKEGRVVLTAVKVGDRVLLPGWGGNAINIGEEVRAYFFSLECMGKLMRFSFFFPRSTFCSRMQTFWQRLRSRGRVVLAG